MSKTSVFFTECGEVKSECVERLEMISLTSDIMYESVSVEEVTTDKKPVETTSGGSGSVSLDNQGGMNACPTDSVENSPTGELVIAGAFMGVTTIYFGGDMSPPMLEKYQSVPPNNRPIIL